MPAITKQNIIVLYTRLTSYALNNINHLCSAANVHLVYYKDNTEYKFEFEFPIGLKIYKKSEMSLNELIELVKNIKPALILVSGWIDKDYISLCKQFYLSSKIVIGIDTQWKGTIRQYINVIRFRLYLKKFFHYIFVAGIPQALYAKHLGYTEEEIIMGLLPADTELFSKYYYKFKQQKESKFPHKFLYVGRYNKIKGVKDLWQAFTELQSETLNDWELICCGSGELENKKVLHSKIHHLGFIQPTDFESVIEDTGIFVFPSRYDGWGVALHEFVTAGYPIITSNKVGAATEFLDEGMNGFYFEAGNIQSLKKVLHKFMDLNNKELLKMSERSFQLSKKNTPELWAQKLLSIIN